MSGATKIPRFPVNAKKLKALACVFGVQFSANIARIVLYSCEPWQSSAMKSDIHYIPSEEASQTPKNYHLPNPFAETKHRSGNSYPNQ